VTEPDPSRRLTITVVLPQPINNVAAILDVVSKHWPDATIDTNHPDGWRVELYAQ
jgi:hypothetical protein